MWFTGAFCAFLETPPGMGTGPWWWRRNINIMMESIFVVKLVCAWKTRRPDFYCQIPLIMNLDWQIRPHDRKMWSTGIFGRIMERRHCWLCTESFCPCLTTIVMLDYSKTFGKILYLFGAWILRHFLPDMLWNPRQGKGNWLPLHRGPRNSERWWLVQRWRWPRVPGPNSCKCVASWKNTTWKISSCFLPLRFRAWRFGNLQFSILFARKLEDNLDRFTMLCLAAMEARAFEMVEKFTFII